MLLDLAELVGPLLSSKVETLLGTCVVELLGLVSDLPPPLFLLFLDVGQTFLKEVLGNRVTLDFTHHCFGLGNYLGFGLSQVEWPLFSYLLGPGFVLCCLREATSLFELGVVAVGGGATGDY